MKELHNQKNQKVYYMSTLTIIVLMVFGLIQSTTGWNGITFGYIIHILCVPILAICLLIYPRYGSFFLRLSIIMLVFIYFYALIYIYPETWTTYILICLIPALAILYFDLKLFYFSLTLNGIFIILTFGYIFLIDQGVVYSYLYGDMVGNLINIMASQVILFLIFHLTFSRIRKQQLYSEQLQQSERLKMIAHLTAAVAHEIRNPVTVVRGFLQLYGKDPSFSDSVKSKFALMIDELNTVEQVTSQFLTLAKPNKDLQPEEVGVREILESVTGLLSSYARLSGKHMDIQVERYCTILINTIEFKQLLMNLIKNALEASDAGQAVKVTARRVKHNVEIKIIDEGSGMSEDQVKSLGTPFYSLKANGTGLGLMICYNIVEKYEGTIEYHSAKGQGTSVTIRFLAKTV
ncbi:ATP-binding protein [Paenibacillus sp. Z3-2]